ncbi:serine/threonine protein kinase [Aequorivita sublithincola DSM 14238]|uniref:non-specific serine/threonine protein kinase n=1 Tax=Aequorivita sublithincola (strain DSM 14238 / LMG 21431 / ACAM 643 / 9-3) TaxID=746697 RepID=I3YRI3_AEQSU|nr:serine/threonine-protein kinase [Aequorivita sublithincola]AFL79601.1 serine/threonine protein kinase [Aequorivita sublithincola DSM 14238]
MSRQGSQYEIIQKLGEGGMGTVYLAKDTLIDRLVAIKQLHRNSGSEEESLGERFQAEALALAKLNHPNVTHLYSFIPLEDTYWMIMEYVEGKTLEGWLFIHKKITHQLAASIAVQILDGLFHAHRKGIIHRDIKPANVMINEDGEVKVMDFGIARMRNAQRITSHGKSVGTLEYMAPEQIQGQEGDERTDVYAVGNILYEMLCGATPFHSDTDYRLMKDKLEKQPESILRENPTVPDSFEKIIFKALQRNPDKRYQTAREMKIAIEKCLDGTLLDQATLSKVLKASQVFTEPEKGNEIISVSKILTRAKSISGRFKVPNVGGFKIPAVGKVNKPYLILGVTVLLCAILLIWGGGSDSNKKDDIPKTPVAVTWEDPADETEQDVVDQNSNNFEETPSEMYKRIAKQPEDKAKTLVKEKKNVKTIENNQSNKSDSKPTNTSKKIEQSENNKRSESNEGNERSEKIEEKRTVPNTPAEVPAGKSILVTLSEDISSEEKERDGKFIRLTCNEDVVSDNRIIILKGAAVTGKIVDCVPSNSRKKALIGFVIIGVEAVDGSTVKLKSKRFKLYADVSEKAISYRSGQTFEAILQRGRVQ